jgi:hypothetical protein
MFHASHHGIAGFDMHEDRICTTWQRACTVLTDDTRQEHSHLRVTLAGVLRQNVPLETLLKGKEIWTVRTFKWFLARMSANVPLHVIGMIRRIFTHEADVRVGFVGP